MGIDGESDVSASLQVGPTTLGMVRLYIEADTIDLPLDFEPEEAEEIAEELVAAAARARSFRSGAATGDSKSPSRGKGRKRQGRHKPRPGSGSSA